VVRVFQAEEAGRRLVDVRLADRGANLLRLQPPVGRLERTQLQSADDGRARHFRMEDMTLALDEHLLARFRMAEEGTEVAHRPARDEERGRLANHLGGALLKPVDSRV